MHSIPLNIAEGNGKLSSRDRARYFDIARGSAVEAAACLDVLRSRRLAEVETLAPAKQQLLEIVNMLIGLMRRNGYSFDRNDDRIREGCPDSWEIVEHEQEHEKE